jgi:hypothetical protein
MNLSGSLPEEWSSWSTIVDLEISGNSLLGGTLPNWGGMKALKSLNLASNNLSGTLPASYGSATWSKNVQFLTLNYNEKLTGTIPGSWSVIKGEINLEQSLWNGEKGITGCVPDQLYNTVRPLFKWWRCSDANNTELLALKTLKDIMDKDGRVLTSWKDDPAEFKPDPLLGRVCCNCTNTAPLLLITTYEQLLAAVVVAVATVLRSCKLAHIRTSLMFVATSFCVVMLQVRPLALPLFGVASGQASRAISQTK